jgi:hypothetical protein
MDRVAHCACGQLRVEVTGEPMRIAACHCEDCQRRTGSVFGVGAYYRAEQVKTSGLFTSYTRGGQNGRQVRLQFCPTCGTTVYWYADFLPGRVGIAVGTFFDPSFPGPTVSGWERSKHEWVDIVHASMHLERGANTKG